jgi:hypothetical protein
MRCSSATVGRFMAVLATLALCMQAIGKDDEYPLSRVGQTQSGYDAAILRDHPVLFLNLGNRGQRRFEMDEAGSRLRGEYLPPSSPPSTVKMPNGDVAAEFDGLAQYLEVPSSPRLSITATGILTIEAWIAPKTLQFAQVEGSGYVYWLGKGEPSQYEYAGRMYSAANHENPPRANRISGYAFNRNGGLGSGSYFQDPVAVDEWIDVTLVFNTRNVSPAFPTGYCSIFKNGILRKVTPLAQFDIEPTAGAAPLRIGTMNGRSFFAGAVGKVAVYDFELSREQILNHARMMLGPNIGRSPFDDRKSR